MTKDKIVAFDTIAAFVHPRPVMWHEKTPL
jgi:hypothetical protein